MDDECLALLAASEWLAVSMDISIDAILWRLSTFGGKSTIAIPAKLVVDSWHSCSSLPCIAGRPGGTAKVLAAGHVATGYTFGSIWADYAHSCEFFILIGGKDLHA